MNNADVKSLGISFSSGNIRFTDLSYRSDNTVLDHADSLEVDFNFEEDLSKFKSNQRALTNISGEIQKYISKRNTHYSNVSVAISTSQAFLITLPIEFSEGKQAINSKIYWELSNYFPDTYSEYMVNTYRLNSKIPSLSTDDFLIIAVHKNTLEFIKRIFKLCGLELSIVDIDHFAAKQNLRRNYADMLLRKNILLIGLKEGRVDYGFISNKKYCYYSYSTYNSKPQLNLCLVRKISSLISTRFAKSGIDSVFIYGDNVTEDILQLIKKSVNMKIQLLNPFESINSSTEILRNEELRRYPFRFAPSCGVALRSLARLP